MIAEEFKKKCKCEEGRVNVDVSKYTKDSIYSKYSTWMNKIDDNWMSKIDIKQVNLDQMMSAKHGSTYLPL